MANAPACCVSADLPPRFTTTIKRCLSRDARDRFPNCEDLVDSLGGDTLVDEDGPKAKPAGIEEDTEPRERPPWTVEKTRPQAPMPQAALEGIAGIVLTVIVLAAALLLGVLGAWAILG